MLSRSGPPSRARLGMDIGASQAADRHGEGVVEMFLRWFNASCDTDPVLKAGKAISGLSPSILLDNGNGRMARAVTDMALARSENSPQRLYITLAQIHQERSGDYDIFEKPQKGTLDITPRIEWFLGCPGRAIDGAQTTLSVILAKSRFWEGVAAVAITERQRLILNRLLDGFTGKLSTSKYAKLAKCSQGYRFARHFASC